MPRGQEVIIVRRDLSFGMNIHRHQQTLLQQVSPVLKGLQQPRKPDQQSAIKQFTKQYRPMLFQGPEHRGEYLVLESLDVAFDIIEPGQLQEQPVPRLVLYGDRPDEAQVFVALLDPGMSEPVLAAYLG